MPFGNFIKTFTPMTSTNKEKNPSKRPSFNCQEPSNSTNGNEKEHMTSHSPGSSPRTKILKAQSKHDNKKIAIPNKEEHRNTFGKRKSLENSNNKSLFISIFKENCSNFNIPQSFANLQKTVKFFDEFLQKLDFLNDQMMLIYSRALCYRNSKGLKKNDFLIKINKKIFEKALKEIDEWMKTYEVADKSLDFENVCNLYSMKSGFTL